MEPMVCNCDSMSLSSCRGSQHLGSGVWLPGVHSAYVSYEMMIIAGKRARLSSRPVNDDLLIVECGVKHRGRYALMDIPFQGLL